MRATKLIRRINLVTRCEQFSTAPASTLVPSDSQPQSTQASGHLPTHVTSTPDNPPVSFWSQHTLRDLENSSVELEVARRHNSSFPYVKDQVIAGQVVKLARDHVIVSTAGFFTSRRKHSGVGHRALHAFAKKELHLSQLVKSTDFGQREGPRDFRVGDVMHFVLSDLQTPFGDMNLRVNKAMEQSKHKAVWQEILEAHRTQKVIKGRVLNKTYGGYAVGVAGLIGFMAPRSAGILTASRIGVLQDFLVSHVQLTEMQFVVTDYNMVRERESRLADFRQRQISKVASLQERLNKLDAMLRADAAGRDSLVLGGIGAGLTRKHNSALLDMIAIWRAELRINTSDSDIVKIDQVPVDALNRMLVGSQGRISTARLVDHLDRLQGTAAGDLRSRILAKLKDWGINIDKKE